MMRYEDENGQSFSGSTPTEVVKDMARTKLTKSRTRRRYRVATARRIEEMTGLTVDPSSDILFLKSLVACSILRRVE